MEFDGYYLAEYEGDGTMNIQKKWMTYVNLLMVERGVIKNM